MMTTCLNLTNITLDLGVAYRLAEFNRLFLLELFLASGLLAPSTSLMVIPSSIDTSHAQRFSYKHKKIF